MVAQTKIIPIAEWMPDSPDFGNPGILVARNITPLSKESYGPVPALVSAGIFPIPEQILGVFTFMDSQEKEHIFAGTPTKLYHLQTGDTVFTDVSRENGPYNAYIANPWVMTVFGPSIIATNGIDPPQTYQPAVDEKFINLANATPAEPATATTRAIQARNAAPVGRCVATVRNWVMLGNINDGGKIYPNRVIWSAIGNPSYWPIPGTLDAAAVQSDFNDLPTGLGWIRGIASGLQAADAAVLCDNGIVSVVFTGSPTTFGFQLAQNAAGSRVANSIITNRGRCYYLGQDGFYSFDGVNGQSIGGTRVDRFFFTDPDDGVDPAFIALTQGAVDTSQRLILWLYPSRGSGGVLDRMLIYNFMLDRWSLARITAQWASKGISFGYSLDQLDPFGPIDTILISFDSPFWKGGSPALYVFDATGHLSTFSGDPLPARVETAEYQFTPSARTRLTSSRPLVDGGTALVAIGTRNRLLEPVTWSPLVQQNYHGECPQRVDARYMRIRVDIPTPFFITETAAANDEWVTG